MFACMMQILESFASSKIHQITACIEWLDMVIKEIEYGLFKFFLKKNWSPKIRDQRFGLNMIDTRFEMFGQLTT
jgi:hypothetical protein